MHKRPILSIIVISFNTREVTVECLHSIYRETHKTPFEIIVVDNASHDGSAEAIRSAFPDVNLIALDENIGFGRANNLASKQASGDFLLLQNPDTVVLDGAIDTLVYFAGERPDRGIWGGRTLFADGTLNPTSCWRGMSLWGLFSWAFGLSTLFAKNSFFNYAGYGGWNRDSIREVDTVTGCFLLIQKQLWEKLDGFDPAFYMYGEEADLCLRARRAGAHPTTYPNAEIIHYGGLSETVPADMMERLLRAKLTLAKKHWGWMRLWLGRNLFCILVGVRALGYSGAARIVGKRSHLEKAAIWRQVWRHRSAWLEGYQ